MSIQHYCDGCGAQVKNPAKVGHVKQRDYCAKCKDVAEEFMAQEESLRKETAFAFAKARAKLIKKFSGGQFKLPDVPEAA